MDARNLDDPVMRASGRGCYRPAGCSYYIKNDNYCNAQPPGYRPGGFAKGGEER